MYVWVLFANIHLHEFVPKATLIKQRKHVSMCVQVSLEIENHQRSYGFTDNDGIQVYIFTDQKNIIYIIITIMVIVIMTIITIMIIESNNNDDDNNIYIYVHIGIHLDTL